MRSFKDFKESIPKQESHFSDETLWKRWNSLTNSCNDAEDGIKSLRSIGSSYHEASSGWTPEDWEACRRYVSRIEKIKRMRQRMVGNPFEREGKPTKWILSLLSLGHDPRKH